MTYKYIIISDIRIYIYIYIYIQIYIYIYICKHIHRYSLLAIPYWLSLLAIPIGNIIPSFNTLINKIPQTTFASEEFSLVF